MVPVVQVWNSATSPQSDVAQTHLPVKSTLGDLPPAEGLVGVVERLVLLDSSNGHLLLLGVEEPGLLDRVGDPEESERGRSDGQDALDDVEILPAYERAGVNLDQAIGDKSSKSAGESLRYERR